MATQVFDTFIPPSVTYNIHLIEISPELRTEYEKTESAFFRVLLRARKNIKSPKLNTLRNLFKLRDLDTSQNEAQHKFIRRIKRLETTGTEKQRRLASECLESIIQTDTPKGLFEAKQKTLPASELQRIRYKKWNSLKAAKRRPANASRDSDAPVFDIGTPGSRARVMALRYYLGPFTIPPPDTAGDLLKTLAIPLRKLLQKEITPGEAREIEQAKRDKLRVSELRR